MGRPRHPWTQVLETGLDRSRQRRRVIVSPLAKGQPGRLNQGGKAIHAISMAATDNQQRRTPDMSDITPSPECP